MRLLSCTVAALLLSLSACASIPRGIVAADQSARPSELVEGSPLYSIIARGAIAPIDHPTWVEHADADMAAEEPVIVVTDAIAGGAGEDVRIYSTWYLEGHEIVNDHIGETPIAVTW